MGWDQYERVKVLGRGAYGSAILVKDRQAASSKARLRVIKEVEIARMKPQERQTAIEEASHLKKLSHINIVAYIDHFVDANKLFIVMEHADGGDLAGAIKARKTSVWKYYTEREVMSIFVQCCLALQHIHNRKILHRDLKAQNIFLTQKGVVKMGDFGIAKVLEHTQAQAMTQIGTPYYLPPEIVNSMPYNMKADVWSLGVVLYEVQTLEWPFNAANMAALVIKILSGEFKAIPQERYSRGVRSLCNRMLQKSAEARPTIPELLASTTVQHWIQIILKHTIEHGTGGSEQQSEDVSVRPTTADAEAKRQRLLEAQAQHNAEQKRRRQRVVTGHAPRPPRRRKTPEEDKPPWVGVLDDAPPEPQMAPVPDMQDDPTMLGARPGSRQSVDSARGPRPGRRPSKNAASPRPEWRGVLDDVEPPVQEPPVVDDATVLPLGAYQGSPAVASFGDPYGCNPSSGSYLGSPYRNYQEEDVAQKRNEAAYQRPGSRDAQSQFHENRRLAQEAKARAMGDMYGRDVPWDQGFKEPRSAREDGRAPPVPHDDGAEERARMDAAAEYRRNREMAAQVKARVEGELYAGPRPGSRGGSTPDMAPEAARARARSDKQTAEEQHMEALKQAAAQAREDRRQVQQRVRERELNPGRSELGGTEDEPEAECVALPRRPRTSDDAAAVVRKRGQSAKEEERLRHEQALEEARKQAAAERRAMKAKLAQATSEPEPSGPETGANTRLAPPEHVQENRPPTADATIRPRTSEERAPKERSPFSMAEELAAPRSNRGGSHSRKGSNAAERDDSPSNAPIPADFPRFGGCDPVASLRESLFAVLQDVLDPEQEEPSLDDDGFVTAKDVLPTEGTANFGSDSLLDGGETNDLDYSMTQPFSNS